MKQFVVAFAIRGTGISLDGYHTLEATSKEAAKATIEKLYQSLIPDMVLKIRWIAEKAI